MRAGDGELFTCGSNESGQLGHLQHTEQMPLARVVALEASIVHAVACGESHSLFVLDNGQLAACGANDFGQLGDAGCRTTEACLLGCNAWLSGTEFPDRSCDVQGLGRTWQAPPILAS